MAAVVTPRPKARTCFNLDGTPKRRFDRKSKARDWVRARLGADWREPDAYGTLNIYECAECVGWHIGHTNKP